MRLLAFIAIISFSIFSASAYAEQPNCATIHNSDERLACYDAKNDTIHSSVGPTPDLSHFTITTDTSPLDDSTKVIIRVRSDDPIPSLFGMSGGHATLLFRCAENTTSVYFSFSDFFMFSDFGGRTDIDYRVDDKPAQNEGMTAASSMQALGHWTGRDAIPFIESLMDATSVYVRSYPMGHSPIEAHFSIEHLRDALLPLRAACSW